MTKGGKTEKANAAVAGFDPAPGQRVITIGYCGDRRKNPGLTQAIGMLQAKHPGCIVVAKQIEKDAPADGKPLDAFHLKLGPVQR